MNTNVNNTTHKNAPVLTIIRGLPGSGKTTYAKTHFPNVFHVETDMALIKNGNYCFSLENLSLAISWINQVVAFSIKREMDIVLSNTFVKVDHFNRYIEWASKHGYEVNVIRMENNFGSVHNVPDVVINKMKANFEDYPGETIVKYDN